MHRVTFTGPAAICQQRTELTEGQDAILRALEMAEPPRFLGVETPAAASA